MARARMNITNVSATATYGERAIVSNASIVSIERCVAHTLVHMSRHGYYYKCAHYACRRDRQPLVGYKSEAVHDTHAGRYEKESEIVH